MPLLERSHRASGQVFMTCTRPDWLGELGRDSCQWEVTAGAVRLAAEGR
jgi:hypothetical protein